MMKELSFWGELTNPLNVTNLLVTYLSGLNLVTPQKKCPNHMASDRCHSGRLRTATVTE